MNTVEYAFVITLAVLLSLFFLLLVVVMGFVLKLVVSVKGIVAKAENVVATAEQAAEVLKDTSGKMAVFKLLRNIVKIVNHK